MKKIVQTLIIATAAVLGGCPIYSGNSSYSGPQGTCGADYNECNPNQGCEENNDGTFSCVDWNGSDASAGACGASGVTCPTGTICELSNGVASCVVTPTPDGGTTGSSDGSVSDGGAHGGDGSATGNGDGSSTGSGGDGSTGTGGDGSSTGTGDGSATGSTDGSFDGAFADGYVPICTTDGVQGGCASGSICLHYECYIACASDAGEDASAVCTHADEFGSCVPVATSSGTYSVCAPTTPGNECNPDAGYGQCAAGGLCINGTCE